MKIEKISDDQVKFILTQTDLSERNIKITELSYGSEKTQELFKEMMEQAFQECDFRAENNTPLIIEAIPVSQESIMIIITKATNQDELENKFNFIPKAREERKFKKKPMLKETGEAADNITSHVFQFKTFDQVIQASVRISGQYSGNNILYKNNGKYYLVLDSAGNTAEELLKSYEQVLNEYGTKLSSSPISKMYLVEHGDIVIQKNAIDVLATHLG